MSNLFQESKQTTKPASTSGFGKKNAAGATPKQFEPVKLEPTPAAGNFPSSPLPVQSAAPSNTNKITVVPPTPESLQPASTYAQESFRRIWSSIRQSADFRQFAILPRERLFGEMRMTVEEVARLNEMQLSLKETEHVTQLIMDEMIGLGPIEHLLARDEVTEIMVNGPKTVYLEMNGVIERSAITFRDDLHLTTICQRIAGQVGRRVDDSSPICDARLQDGSRVNIILPPLAIDGAILTIRKFQKERLTLEKLLGFGSVDESTAEMLRIIAACRINILISGGTGSGKTTLLNCLTRYINPKERVVTCEDAAELQLQQPHVVRLETRPPGIEGSGEVSMRDLVRNCLRMRPDRIVVGEVRGPEAFDLLQAMNTGHDGSMGTVHANTPRDALGRLESMIAMSRLNIPPETVRHQIASSVNVIVQIQRLKDGSRKVMSITETTGMEGDIISLQDLVTYVIEGESEDGRVKGSFRQTGLRPRFAEKLRQYGMEDRFLTAMEKGFLKQ
ncbi:MAG: CpaF family protein [Alphaproteobacteria bacterium]